MSEPMKASGHVSTPSFCHDSVISSTEHTRPPIGFPPNYRLIGTTTRGVYAWDMSGVVELFRSGSEGIVAARKLDGNSGTLAVADSHVVVLHDIHKGMQRSYRLKGSEGQIRLLRYAGNSSKNLFFTTTLQNSVQSFSLKHSKLLDPFDTHPSPPSIFALSCDSHLLLSTSSRPPTIHLRDLALNAPPVLVLPRCSSSAVVAADFHPEQPSVFVLAFADGSAAVYDAIHMLRHNGRKRERAAGAAGSNGEIASIKALHATVSRGRTARSTSGDLVEAQDPANVPCDASGITAIALVPGHRATAVTVGADGKCCVVDFTQPHKERAILLRTWHLRRPATSLSVIYSGNRAISGHWDGPAPEHLPPNKDFCLAVGRQDGKVLLFDLDGHPLGEHFLDPQRARIIDIEWVETEEEPNLSEKEARNDPGLARKTNVKRKIVGNPVIKGQPEGGDLRPDVQDSLFDFVTPPRKSSKDRHLTDSGGPIGSVTAQSHSSKPPSRTHLPRKSVPALNHLDLVERNAVLSSEGSHLIECKSRARKASADKCPGLNSTVNAEEVECTKSVTPRSTGTFSNGKLPPPIPPRPIPKAGGLLSMRRARTAGEAASQKEKLSVDPNQRRVSVGNTRSNRRISRAIAPSKTKVLIGPRSLHKGPVSASVQTSKTKPEPDFLDRPSPDLHLRAPATTSETSTKSSPRTYTTAPSQFHSSYPSEASNDTVVSWSPASSHQPVPSFLGTPLIINPPASPNLPKSKGKEQKRPKKKGHVSLSLSTPSLSSSSTDTIVNWPKYKDLTHDLEQQQQQGGIPNPTKYNPQDSHTNPIPDLHPTTPSSNDRISLLDSATAIVLESGGYYSRPFSPDHGTNTTSDTLTAAHAAETLPAAPAPAPAEHQDNDRKNKTRTAKKCNKCACHHCACACACACESPSSLSLLSSSQQSQLLLQKSMEKGFEGLKGEITRLFAEQRAWVRELLSIDDDDGDIDDDYGKEKEKEGGRVNSQLKG